METIDAKTIVTKNKSTAWFGCEYNMNIYRGCCHGCIYCDSRSNCYQNQNFDTVKAKKNALAIIRDDLARKVRKGVISTGAMSDPYNPHEQAEQLTRHALELADAYGFGVAIATKSPLITRDIDILRDIQIHSPVLCKITITTPNDDLASKIEPFAPASSQRFAAVEALSQAGLFSGILLMPVLPFLQDDKKSILTMVEMAAEAGARFIHPTFGVTMRAGQREYFLQQLEQAFPGEGLAEKYAKRFGDNYYCSSPRAKSLWHSFAEACEKKGILYQMHDIVRAYRQGHKSSQLSLFDL